MTTPTIRPCLWFDDDLEDAFALYASLFPDAEVGHLHRTEDGSALTGEITLAGTTFQAINGGPMFSFTEAVSFSITCADQAEVDHYWHGLLADGGRESQCGWLKDRFGLSWQVVPQRLFDLLGDPVPERARAAQAAMMQMVKIDVAALEAAADAAAPAAPARAGAPGAV